MTRASKAPTAPKKKRSTSTKNTENPTLFQEESASSEEAQSTSLQEAEAIEATGVTASAPSQEAEAPDLQAIRQALLDWYDHQQRDLPWRETKDPYAIWLSEIMLQQTRVETVRPYYAKFLERFPTVMAMAEADMSEVLALWSGLGYYRRAKNLHAAAQMVTTDYGGAFPDTFEGIRSLKGVGRYTAGAIASIAYDLPYAAVDGNVHRVFSRIFWIEEAVGSAQLDKRSWHWAEQLVQGERPGDFNQALMELGAMVCTPRSPTCMFCPVRVHCKSHERGETTKLPLPRPAKEIKTFFVYWLALQRTGKILLVKRPNDGLFADMWELPGLYLEAPSEDALALLNTHLESIGLSATLDETPAAHAHTLTHRQLDIAVYQSRNIRGKVTLPREQWLWFDPQAPAEIPLSSITQRVLQSLEAS